LRLYCTVEEEWENCGCIDWFVDLCREEELKGAMTLKGS
jgi:PII-like signaling protein